MAQASGSWICDGVPKNGQTYANASGPHQPYENYGPDCALCGLPREAMGSSAPPSGKMPIAAIIAALVVLALLGGGGFLAYRLMAERSPESLPTTTGSVPSPTPITGLISQTSAANSAHISQGEKILLNEPNPQRAELKQKAAQAFAQEDWPTAIETYQQLADQDPNDPEPRIYLNNARARQNGQPLTLAAVVPISQSPDTAKEILRGVAQYQDQFNRQSPSRLLEVAIANENTPNGAPSLANDLISIQNIQGVLGHGVDGRSREALEKYEQAQMAALSPLTTSVNNAGGGRLNLQTLSLSQKGSELLTSYLDNSAKTLAEYAAKNVPNPKIALIYNSDSPYSDELKTKLAASIPQFQGQVVTEIDSAAANFNPSQAVSAARQAGANTMILALSRAKVDDAISLAIANQANGTPMVLLGSDQLYTPDLLLKGDRAIADIVLAVPWSTSPGDPFAQEAAEAWKGRVSWRTTTAYDATQALVQAMVQGGDRLGVNQILSQGVQISGTTTQGSDFDQVPLVKAVPGTSGPRGSNYQFDPIL